MAKFAESREESTEFVQQNGIKISHYITPAAFKGIGITGQAEAQYYFHRPLSEYLRIAFAVGFVLDGLEEPTLPREGTAPGGLRWGDMPELPSVLAVRLKL